MPNTSSSVPFLLSSSMQSIRSRRPSTVLSSGPLGSGSGLLQQLGSGMVRQLTASAAGSGAASPIHHAHNGHGGAGGRFNYVRKCPSLNITFSNWNSILIQTNMKYSKIQQNYFFFFRHKLMNKFCVFRLCEQKQTKKTLNIKKTAELYDIISLARTTDKN